MALVLAIEPNSAQAAVLRRLLGTRADTDVVVVGSTDAAVAAIDKRVPDLVLVGALLSPRDEDPFIAHLRALPDAGHLQTLTIPQLRQTSGGARRSMSIFRKRKRRRTDDAAGGCDPTQFGDEVAADLSRACEVKAEIEQRQTAAGEEEPPVAESPEPVGSHSSGSVEGPSPQDARRFTDPGSGLEGVQDQSEGMQHQGVAAPEAGTVPRAETQTLAAELGRVRADAERTLGAELAAAEGRHAAEMSSLETAAAESLAAELDRVRADAERTLAAELAAAEHRHGAAMTSFQTEATESPAAAAREAQAAAEAQAAQTLAAELERVRADAERTLAAGLAAAERRHSAELARLETAAAEHRHGVAMLSVETEAAEIRAAVAGDARAAAAAQATQTLTAELERVRADGERTLAAELAAAEHRHGAAMTSLETAAAESRAAAARDARAAAEAQAAQTLAAELERVRADAERTLAAELATAEHRHGAELARLETAAADSRAAATRDVQTAAVAQRVRAEATRQAVAREADAGRDPLRAAAPSISISLRPSLEPVHRAERDAGGVADYYSLWQARIAAANAPRVEVGVALPPGVDPRRRRWALSVAATLLILLLNNPESGSAPRHAVAAVEAASVSHAIEPAPIPGGVGLRDPREPVAEDTPGTGVSGRTQFRQLPMEVMCVLAVMLLLRIALFVGEGFVWHGLVASLGLVLLGFALMRAPWGG